MVIDILLLLLSMTFIVHLLILVFYLLNKTNVLFIWFITTAFANIIIGMILAVVALKNPERIKIMNLDFIFWVLSGFISTAMLLLKSYIFFNVYKRSRDPKAFHYNLFGKKVYNISLVKYYEIAILILSMPFFLIFGAYFIAKLGTVSF